jgi:hypothetical protein
MGRYLAVHRVKKIFTTQEAWLNDWGGLVRRAQDKAGSPQWLMSFYSPQAGKLYCEWEAASKDDIVGCFTEEEIEMAPFESVEEVVRIDPAWLK